MIKKSIYCIFIFLYFLCLSSISAIAQNKYTISGYVKDSKTGEALIGATVIIKELIAAGTYTNAYGFYSITIPAGTYNVSTQFVGYEVVSVNLVLKQNVKQDFSITEKINMLKEIVISGEKKEKNITKINSVWIN